MKPAVDRGFSLIELILVILLVGIMAVTITPNGCSMLPTVRVDAAAERVASDIKYARDMAIKEGGHVGVVFTTASNSYAVMKNLTTPVADPMRGGSNLTLSFNSEARFGGVVIQSATFGSGSTLQFDNIGTPRDAAYAELAADGTVTVIAGGVTKTVTVAAVTGKVTR